MPGRFDDNEPMKRVLILSSMAALALSAAAVAFAHGPGPRGPAGHVGVFGVGAGIPQAWKDCLAKQGLTPPGREGERHARKGEHPSAADLAKRKAAFDACKQYLPAPVKARQDAFEQFRSCLKKQGLPAPPARGTKPSDADKAKFKAAFDACKQYLPAPVKARLEAFEQFRSCLQKQGLAPPVRGTEPSDADKAKRKAAFDACKSLLPARPHPTATMRFR